MPLAFWILMAPLLWLAWQWIALLAGWPNALGFNPIQATHHFLGQTAIRVLLVALAITPARDWTGYAPLLRIRRRVGLFAFGYALLHLLAYFGLDLFFSLSALWADVVERTYITFGMAALVLLIPLAITSHNALIRQLGSARWRRLHWLVYPLAALAVTHHVFAERGAQLGPWAHAGILAALLGWRAAKWAGLAKPRVKRAVSG
ncbi:MAG: sulfoxide reductase heme-binding subunit YedZ [Caulobacterales bacterium]|nr:sulfoxide reductase heme-binding subunit YedZ [Caulobacterales bacterium]